MNEKLKKNISIQWLLLLVFAGILVPIFIDNNYNGNSGVQSSSLIIDEPNKQNNINICDGINIMEDCELEGVQYIKYKYYPAEEEVAHFESKTTYVKEIVGYCTLCNDGTRSPSCSTGRGTCSHHGGVAQWNAPIYNNVPHTEQIKVIDSPAVAEWYDTILK